MFYADDGRIAGSNPIWVQGTMTTPMHMVDRLVRYMNLGYNKSMTFIPGLIWGQMFKDSYKRRAMGKGAKFWEQKCTTVS